MNNMQELKLDVNADSFYYVLCECCYTAYIRVYTISRMETDRFSGHCETCIKLGFHDNSIYNCLCIDSEEDGQYNKRRKNKANKRKNKQKRMDDHMPSYVAFTKEEFETEIKGIAEIAGLTVREVFKNGVHERMYDMTTYNSAIRCLIYSTVPLNRGNADARDVGEDAVRVQLWIKTEDGVKFKNFKRHYRTEGLFRNLAKTVGEIQTYVNSKEASKWLFAANKAARDKKRKEF